MPNFNSPTRDQSPPSSSDSGNSPASTSRIHLPPNISSEEQYLAGEYPSVLADRILHHRPGLQSRTGSHASDPSPSTGKGPSRPGGLTRAESLMAVFQSAGFGDFGGKKKQRNGEEEPLLTGEEGGGRDDETDGEEEALLPDGAPEGGPDRPRNDRSRSQSRVRKLPWHKRASPVWFLPGTMLIALSIGMIIAPKLEIYIQLVCRAMPEPDLPAPPATFSSTVVQTLLASSTAWDETGSRSPSDEADWARRCRSRVDVQKAVIPFAMALTLSSGLLSALTTGYWGALSDRRGRKPILALSLLGMLIMDSVFLFVMRYHNLVGYKFLLVGPAIDGLLGGFSTAQAATNAYLSDCTDVGSRARVFSILGGLLFGGIALGPTIGSLVIGPNPSPSAVLRPFYVALTMHFVYFLFVAFVIPESLSKARQYKARERWAEESQSRGGWRPWSFLRPLGLLLPRGSDEVVEGEDLPILWSGKETGGVDATKKQLHRRRFALPKITFAYAFYATVIAVGAVRMQYTQFRFGWGPVENGYFLSFSGASRMVVLVGILPLLIYLFRKPPPLPAWDKPDVSEGAAATEEEKRLIAKWDTEAKFLRVTHDSYFDLFLARVSIFIDFIGFVAMAFPTSPVTFIIVTFIQGLGGGAGPALQSLALAHTSSRDTGRLFASFSVLQALCSQVAGPVFFGFAYLFTLSFWPEGIYGLASDSNGVIGNSGDIPVGGTDTSCVGTSASISAPPGSSVSSGMSSAVSFGTSSSIPSSVTSSPSSVSTTTAIPSSITSAASSILSSLSSRASSVASSISRVASSIAASATAPSATPTGGAASNVAGAGSAVLGGVAAIFALLA